MATPGSRQTCPCRRRGASPPAGGWLVILLTLFMTTLCTPVRTAYVVHAGRHVCMTQHRTYTPTKIMQTYYRPMYKKHVRMCDNSSYRLCTSFRLVYVVAYREAYTSRVGTRTVYSCCPGWERATGSSNGCLKPICSRTCRHGGQCIQPNVCRCRPGWTGRDCGTDIDECRTTVPQCKHMCTNTAGSYTCTCHYGYQLAGDGRSCQVCLTCSPEFKDLTDSYQDMARRVLRLERDNTELRHAIAEVGRAARNGINKLRYDVMDMMDDVKATDTKTTASSKPTSSTTSTTSSTTSASTSTSTTVTRVTSPSNLPPTTHDVTHESHMVMERLQSLSRQIAFLEERLGFCHCDSR